MESGWECGNQGGDARNQVGNAGNRGENIERDKNKRK